MTETEITRSITDWLKTLPNVWWMKIYGQGFSRGGKQKTGIPDLCIESTRHGRLWVEVKTPKGKLEPTQEREFPKMQAAGAKVVVVRSLDELREIMDTLEMEYYA